MAKRVQVVLNEDILSLGKDGDLVEVAPGYARNFLLPYGKALPVTPAVMKQVEHRRAKKAAQEAALKQEALDFQTALITIRWRLFDYTEEMGKDHPYYKQLRGYVDGLGELSSTINSVTTTYSSQLSLVAFHSSCSSDVPFSR